MQQHERLEFQPFDQDLYKLYAAKEKKSYMLPLVSFMLKHRKEIFMLSKKGFASQLVEILNTTVPEICKGGLSSNARLAPQFPEELPDVSD